MSLILQTRQNTFEDNLDNVCEIIKETLKQKNVAYNGMDTPFKSFEVQAEILRVPAEKIFLSRMMDKIGRASNLLSSEDIDQGDEALEDTIMDLLGYALLLVIYSHE